ncbi:MAG: diaminopropionate ammonia-lyase, partial [Alphaproteobacteria bacterium]
MTLPRFPLQHVHNRNASPTTPFGAAERRILSDTGHAAARREIASWPGYRPTPLVDLPGLAARVGVARLWYKDEGKRFGLRSFKPLGGAYAVLR